MSDNQQNPKGDCVDLPDRALSNESERLHDAEMKLAKARRERAGADELERQALEEIAEVEERLKCDKSEHAHLVHFEVDGEDFTIKRDESFQSPNQIIEHFAKRKPETHYLVKISGHHRTSYEGKGDTPIQIENCDKFQTICTGPTPVSDGHSMTATAVFVNGLRRLGYEPTQCTNHAGYIYFDYEVPIGKYAGLKIAMGLIVPQDFPITPPSGPHISAKLRPNASNGCHPSGGIHDSSQFESAVGGQWQYWSRPFPDWAKTNKTVSVYMGHIFRLWQTQ